MPDKEDHEKKEIEVLAHETDHIILAIWAADCAEHVLYCFEEKNPNDHRPREAIEAAKSWSRGKWKVGEARSAAFAAHAAARQAEEGPARSAARAAGHAAATAHVPGHAIHAANYAAKTMPGERPWQYQRLVELRGEE